MQEKESGRPQNLRLEWEVREREASPDWHISCTWRHCKSQKAGLAAGWQFHSKVISKISILHSNKTKMFHVFFANDTSKCPSPDRKCYACSLVVMLQQRCLTHPSLRGRWAMRGWFMGWIRPTEPPKPHAWSSEHGTYLAQFWTSPSKHCVAQLGTSPSKCQGRADLGPGLSNHHGQYRPRT